MTPKQNRKDFDESVRSPPMHNRERQTMVTIVQIVLYAIFIITNNPLPRTSKRYQQLKRQ